MVNVGTGGIQCVCVVVVVGRCVCWRGCGCGTRSMLRSLPSTAHNTSQLCATHEAFHTTPQPSWCACCADSFGMLLWELCTGEWACLRCCERRQGACIAQRR